MSFGFQFDDDELDEEYKDSTGTRKQESAEDDSHESESKASTSTSKATRHTLDELLSALPSRISYSSLTIPLKESNRTLYRRDLFDARFQLINDDQGEDRAESEDRFSAGTQTDLIPGIYEGGFKTWECAIDLVAHLEERISQQEGLSWLKDVRATELGCGTALPSMYLFARMLSTTDEEIDSSFVLCDFNEQVLRLVGIQ
jgi:protein-histidine N-methyltransferase